MKILYSFAETLYGMIPSGGIKVQYDGEAEILFSDRNEEYISDIKIITVVVTVNGNKDPFAYLPDEKIAPKFYRMARLAARQAWFEMRCKIQ